MSFNVLREYPGLTEHEKPPYLINHGNKTITNATTFPALPNSGIVMRALGITGVGLLAARHDSEEAMAAYVAHEINAAEKMEANYNYIDLVANGSSTIIVLSGCAASSDSTARVGVPGNFVDLKYTMTQFGNRIKVEWFFDELSYGAIVITSTDMTATVEQSGPSQLKLTVGTSVFFIDVTTKSSAVVEHLIGGTLVRSRAVKFNTNGMNPMVTMNSVVVPVTT